MPANAGQANAYSIGKDAVFTIIGPYGPVSFGITSGTFQQITDSISSRPLNQPPAFAEIPAGWQGSINFDRTGPQLDDLMAQMETDYWAGGILYKFSITQTIDEPFIATTQYRFDPLVIKLDEGGTFSANEKVSMRLGFKASRRYKVI